MSERFTLEQAIIAIRQFLEWGEKEAGKSQQGYFQRRGMGGALLTCAFG